jgi:hypothetical protein
MSNYAVPFFCTFSASGCLQGARDESEHRETAPGWKYRGTDRALVPARLFPVASVSIVTFSLPL